MTSDRGGLTAGEVTVGDTGPEIVERIDRELIVRYAGASGGFNRVHYDDQFAREAGYPTVIAHGMQIAGFLSHMVTDWFGLGNVRRFQTRSETPVFPGDTITTQGEVTEKRLTDGWAIVVADIAAIDQDGDAIASGEVVVELPVDGG